MSDPYSILANVRNCLLCAHDLSPHDIGSRPGRSASICGDCGALARKWGNAKVHLILEGDHKGMYSKADFMATLRPETYRVIRNTWNGDILKIFGADQDDEYEDWLLRPTTGEYEVEEEEAFQWPLGMLVERWNKYKYEGTFEITAWTQGKRRRMVLRPELDPIGTEAHIHNSFGEMEPALRYRRFLDPNWQCSLPTRVKHWKPEEVVDLNFPMDDPSVHRLAGWKISQHFVDKSYEYWRYIG